MDELSQRIKKAIQKSGYSYGELAQITKIPKSALQRYATGETPKVPLERIEKIAAATHVKASYLLGWEDEKEAEIMLHPAVHPVSLQKVPLLGRIACGQPIVANEEYETFVIAGERIKADFALIAQGDSMIGAGIKDGSLVFIHKQDTVENGEIAAVINDDEVTLKRVYYYPEQAQIVLVPENSAFAPMVFSGEQLEHIHILGKAVACQNSLQ